MHRSTLIGGLFLGVLTLVALAPVGQGQGTGPKTYLGKPAPDWAAKLTDSDIPTRRSAAFALGKLGYFAQPFIPNLLQTFQNDADPTVKDAAAFAIGEICKTADAGNSEAIVAAMSQTLMNSDADPLVKRSAAYAVGSLGPKGVNGLAALDKAISDPKSTPAVKQNAAWALGQIGKGSGILSLTKALGNADPQVIRDAANAVKAINDSMEKAGLGFSPADKTQIVIALQPHLTIADVEARKSVLSALPLVVGKGDAKTLGPVLQQMVKNDREDPDARYNAALALGNMGGDPAADAVNFLIQVMTTGELSKRRQASSIIGNIGKPALPAVPVLKLALKDKDTMIRANSAVSLGGIGFPMNPDLPGNKGKPQDPERGKITDAVPDLIEVLGNTAEDPAVRAAAAVALKEIGRCPQLDSPRSLDVMIDIILDKKNTPELRARTLWPMRLRSNVANEQKFIDALNTIVETEPINKETKDLRYDCAQLLGHFKKKDVSNKVLDTLLEFLKDESVFIAQGSGGTVGTGGTGETGVGGSKTAIGKGGDGRVIALKSLMSVINEKYGGNSKLVINRKDIMDQLKILTTAKDSDVVDLSKQIVKYLSTP